MADANAYASTIAIYNTGAFRDGAWQEDITANLGGHRAGTRSADLTIIRRAAMYGVRVERVGARCGEGLGYLQAVTADSLAFKAPGDTYGATVAIADGETKTLLSSTTNKWIKVTRASSSDLIGTEELTLRDTYDTAIAGPPFDDETDTDYTYSGHILRNDGEDTVTVLKVTHPDTAWIAVGQEAVDGNLKIQTIANKYAAPAAVDFGAEWAGAGVTLAPGGTIGLWIRRSWTVTISAKMELIVKVEYTADGHASQTADGRGLTLRGKDSHAAYLTYLGTDSEPDFDGAIEKTSTTEPYDLDPFSASTEYRWETLWRNKWGLVAKERQTEGLVLDGSGNGDYLPPSGPSYVGLYQREDGKVLVEARYLPMAEGAGASDWWLRAANKWLIYLTADGVDPVPGVDTPTVVSMSGNTATDMSMFMEVLSNLSASQTDEAPIKVIVQTRRDDGVTTSDSTNTTVYSTTAAWYQAQARRPVASVGHVEGFNVELAAYANPTIYIDEDKNIRWEIDGEDVHFYADATLVWTIRNNVIRFNLDIERWDPSGSGSGAIEVGTWDGAEKTIWINVAGSHMWKIDALNGVLYVADREFVDEAHENNAPFPIWEQYAYTGVNRWDGESGLWVTAFDIDTDGVAHFSVDREFVGDTAEGIS